MSEEDFSDEDLLSGNGDSVEKKLFKMTLQVFVLS